MTEGPDWVPIFCDVLVDLASELDLHYEDHQVHALEASVNNLVRGADLLAKVGAEIPEEVRHMIQRFQRYTRPSN